MKHELLAPAGNIEAGYAALYYGADAVYLGLNKFSARAGAENFTFEELDEFSAYAHTLKRKVFVALNTILSEEEIKELPEIFEALKKAQIDGLIIQDLGVFYLAKKFLPNVELHASTQMAVHNLEGARFLQKLGFKRVVLARELTLDEIKKIAEGLPQLDLEVFVHGALCYSYSGQCLFSALEYGKSANRGRCVYPCRAAYHDEKGSHLCQHGEHIFSMKDLALEEEILKIPAVSLKIEGRKKSPLYVAAVTNYYRHILDGKKKILSEAEDIKQIFSRPWCRFHVNGKDKNVTDREFVGHRGLLIGQVEKVNQKYLSFVSSRDVARFDGLQIDVKGEEKPFGFSVKNLTVKGKSVFEAKKGTEIQVELPEKHIRIELGAPIYLSSSTAVKGRYDYDKPKPKAYRHYQHLMVKVEISKDEIWAMSGQQAVSLKGAFDVAKDADKTKEAVYKAFAKTKDSAVCFDEIEVDNSGQRFVPISVLNELRRQLVDAVSCEEKGEEFVLPKVEAWRENENHNYLKINTIDLNLDSSPEDFDKDKLKKTWFRLPQICRNVKKLKEVIERFYEKGARQFVAENYYAFDVLSIYDDVKIGAGSFIYVMNRYGAEVLKEMGAEWCMPALESSPENMKALVLTSPLRMVQLVKGYPPLFTSAVCIRDNDCASCNKKAKQWFIENGGRVYKVVSQDCEIKLYNTKPYQREIIPGMWGIIE